MNFKTRLGKRERSIIEYLKKSSIKPYFKSRILNHETLWKITDSTFPNTIFNRKNERYIKRVLKRLIQKGIVIRMITGRGFVYALFPEISFNMKKVSDRAIEMDISSRICHYWENPRRG